MLVVSGSACWSPILDERALADRSCDDARAGSRGELARQLETLRSTYRTTPTRELAAVRAEVLRELGVEFPEAEAPCATRQALLWLRWLQREGWLEHLERGECGCSIPLPAPVSWGASPGWHHEGFEGFLSAPLGPAGRERVEPCGFACDVATAVQATRWTVERAVAAPAFLEAFDRAIVLVGGVRAARRCGDGAGECAVRRAVVEHVLALSPHRPQAVAVPARGSLESEVSTIYGIVPIHSGYGAGMEQTVGYGPLQFFAVRRLDDPSSRRMDSLIVNEFIDGELRRGDPVWDEAPAYVAGFWWDGLSYFYVLAEVRGRFRVVASEAYPAPEPRRE
jgi:hypothetical protein